MSTGLEDPKLIRLRPNGLTMSLEAYFRLWLAARRAEIEAMCDVDDFAKRVEITDVR